MDQMRGALRAKNPILSFPAFGEAGDHRLGASQLSVWRERRRRYREAEVRSLLHSTLFAQARRDDCAEDGAYRPFREGTLSAREALAQRVIGYRLSVIDM